MSKSKFEVMPYNSGGFFIHGGSIGEIYVKEKVDADAICNALNTCEILKIKRFRRRLEDAFTAIDELEKELQVE